MDVVKMYKDLNRKPCETMAQAYTRGHKAGKAEGRAEALDEYINILKKEADFCEKYGDLVTKIIEQLKEGNK